MPDGTIVVKWNGKRYALPANAVELNKIILPKEETTYVFVRFWPQPINGVFDLTGGCAKTLEHVYRENDISVVARFLNAAIAEEVN